MRLVREVYRVTSKLANHEQFSLTGQILRSTLNIPSNITQGAGRGGRAELIRFLAIARGSRPELDTRCSIACDLKCFSSADALQESIQLLIARLNPLITSKCQSTNREPE